MLRLWLVVCLSLSFDCGALQTRGPVGGAILASGARTSVQLNDCELEANMGHAVCAPELYFSHERSMIPGLAEWWGSSVEPRSNDGGQAHEVQGQ